MVSKATNLFCFVSVLQIKTASFLSIFKTYQFSMISEVHKTLEDFKIPVYTTCYKMLEVFQNETLMSLRHYNKKGKTHIYLN